MPRSTRLIRLLLAVACVAVVIAILRRRQSGDRATPAASNGPPLDLERRSADSRSSALERAPSRALEVAPSVEVEPVEPQPTAGTAAWVEPSEGSCPSSHPVKAKLSSKIFHVPGGASYQRTKADRCYVDPAAAEADGFRRSKA